MTARQLHEWLLRHPDPRIRRLAAGCQLGSELPRPPRVRPPRPRKPT